MSSADCNILLPSLAWTAFYLRMALVQCSNCIYKIKSIQAKVTELTGILITGQCEVSDKKWYKSLNSANKDVRRAQTVSLLWSQIYQVHSHLHIN